MKNKKLLHIFLFLVLSSVVVFAQNSNGKKTETQNNTGLLKTTATSGDSISFTDSDGNTLLKVTDEGITGSITIPSAGSAPSTTTNKLYNVGSTLYFNGSALGSGATKLNDLSDAKSVDGTSLFLGQGAGSSDAGLNSNTAVGLSALHSNTVGQYNSANGNGSLYFNTSGSNNVAIGFSALHKNTTGGDNVANGYSALAGNTTGKLNVALGSGALFNNSSGDSNAVAGFRSLYSNTTGKSNTAFGTGTLYNNNAGNDGVAVGYQSQYYVNNSATAFTNSNTSVGYQSLMGSTTPANNIGIYNSALGYQALRINTTGSRNSATGVGALYSNTGGNDNTANGFDALGYTTTGSGNSAIGVAALQHTTTGSFNTANGKTALVLNTTGSYNTAIGYNAGPGAGYTGLTNTTCIGNGATVTASNTIRIGDNNITAIYAKVGITSASDSTKKENFLKVNGEKTLEKYGKFRLTSWNFKGDNPKTERHYGIMAQVFFSAFGHDKMGTIGNDTTINVMDEAGVNMIAIQTLLKKVTKQQTEINNQKDEIAGLQKEVKELNKMKNEFTAFKSALTSFIENGKSNQTKLTLNERH